MLDHINRLGDERRQRLREQVRLVKARTLETLSDLQEALRAAELQIAKAERCALELLEDEPRRWGARSAPEDFGFRPGFT